MFDQRQCLTKAEEAERLAAMVSYGTDKARLQAEAASWRDQAKRAAQAEPGRGDAAQARR